MNSSVLKTSQDQKLIDLISPWIAPFGYQVIHLEILSHRQRVLRVFIDYLNPQEGKTIGIEDCVQVSRILDERLDQNTELQALFPGTYELEVSSPGVDRPLRSLNDYQRFKGQLARIHVYRPLSSEELEDSNHQAKNPKQKNFLGVLAGTKEEKVLLQIYPGEIQRSGKKSNKTSAGIGQASFSLEKTITIPLSLISKANLEPVFELESSSSDEERPLREKTKESRT